MFRGCGRVMWVITQHILTHLIILVSINQTEAEPNNCVTRMGDVRGVKSTGRNHLLRAYYQPHVLHKPPHLQSYSIPKECLL